MLRLLAAAAVVISFPAAPEAAAEVATGCLTRSGSITKLALGNEPARRCGRRQTEISLPLANPGLNESVRTFAVELAGAEEHELSPGMLLSCQFLGGSSYRAVVILDLPYVRNSDLDTLSVSLSDQITKSSVTRYYPLIKSIDDTNLRIERATAEITGIIESIDLLTASLEAAWIDGAAVCRFWGRLEIDHIQSFDLLGEETQ